MNFKFWVLKISVIFIIQSHYLRSRCWIGPFFRLEPVCFTGWWLIWCYLVILETALEKVHGNQRKQFQSLQLQLLQQSFENGCSVLIHHSHWINNFEISEAGTSSLNNLSATRLCNSQVLFGSLVGWLIGWWSFAIREFGSYVIMFRNMYV